MYLKGGVWQLRVLGYLLSYLSIEREKYIYEAYSSLYLIYSPFLFT
jgi:hypothetical protein